MFNKHEKARFDLDEVTSDDLYVASAAARRLREYIDEMERLVSQLEDDSNHYRNSYMEDA